MSEDIITASGIGASEPTRKVVSGWKEMQKARESGIDPRKLKQERILKENKSQTSQIDSNFKPGDDKSSESFSYRKAKQHLQKLNEQKQTQKVFKGNAQQITMKLILLTVGDNEVNIKGGNIVKVISCEEAGLGQYKLTYLLES